MTDSKANPSVAAAFDEEAAHAALQAWLTEEAWRIRNPQKLVAETCRHLVAAGIPIDVFNAWVFMLHPDYFGVVHRWEASTDRVETNLGSHAVWQSDMVQKSPLAIIRDSSAAAHRRLLCRDGAGTEFPVMQEYVAAGATDYVVMRLPFSDNSNNMISFTTRQSGGFTTGQIAVVDSLLYYLARMTEVQAVRFLATVLLDTYVGKQSGAEILSGNIRRGHGDTLRAVILMTDLQGFTELSNSLPRDTLIDHLNAYFDAFGEPVQAGGGEILKFIGDAMLAIFPVGRGPDDARDACRAALAAARDGIANVSATNRARAAEGLPEIRCGAALHVGEVMYGNIGAGARLDFTVIGPAVNLAARLEATTREFDTPLVLSGDFVRAADIGAERLGDLSLKGFEEPVPVFAPAADG